MITLILGFITRWKWIFIGLGVVFVFFLGYHTRTLIYKAGEVGQANKTIDRLEGEVKTQSDIAQATAQKNAAQAEIINVLQLKIDSSYDKTPAITNPCIAAIRVSTLNQQRKAADARRAR